MQQRTKAESQKSLGLGVDVMIHTRNPSPWEQEEEGHEFKASLDSLVRPYLI